MINRAIWRYASPAWIADYNLIGWKMGNVWFKIFTCHDVDGENFFTQYVC